MLVSSIRFKRFLMFTLISSIFLITCGVRLAQYILMGQKPGKFWLMDVSLLLVPFMSVWQILPVIYYVYICSVLRYSFQCIRERMDNDKTLSKKPLKFYLEKFCHLTEATRHFSEFMGPTILFGLGISIAVLCLTAYFLIYSDMALQLPENATYIDYIDVKFLPVWAGIQILTAFATLFAYCVAGCRVNEMVM